MNIKTKFNIGDVVYLIDMPNVIEDCIAGTLSLENFIPDNYIKSGRIKSLVITSHEGEENYISYGVVVDGFKPIMSYMENSLFDVKGRAEVKLRTLLEENN